MFIISMKETTPIIRKRRKEPFPYKCRVHSQISNCMERDIRMMTWFRNNLKKRVGYYFEGYSNILFGGYTISGTETYLYFERKKDRDAFLKEFGSYYSIDWLGMNSYASQV